MPVDRNDRDEFDVCMKCGYTFYLCNCSDECDECGFSWAKCVCSEVICTGCDELLEDCVCESDSRLDEFEDGMSDVEADADTLRSAGWGTDEEYGYFGDEGDF